MSEQKTKCYISGKISGLPILNSYENFNRASNHAIELGYEPVNPMDIIPDGDKPKKQQEQWYWYMRADLKALLDCDAILMQPNWNDSKGAIVEHDLATKMNLRVIFMEEKDFVSLEDKKELKKVNDKFFRISMLTVFVVAFMVFLLIMCNFFKV